MLTVTNPLLLILLASGVTLLLVFLFVKRLSIFGNLLGVACISAYVTLSFVFGAGYLEVIGSLIVAALIYFSAYIVKGKVEG